MKIKLKKIQSQKDERWKRDELSNGVSIGDYGCLATCISMIGTFLGKKETPDEVVRKLKKVNGLDNRGNYVWGSIEKIYKDLNIKEKYTRTNFLLRARNIAEIKNSIDSGMPVMIWLDYNPKTVKSDMHWVLITGYDNNDEDNFTIADPIDGKEKSLKKYLGWWKPSARRTIEAYVTYSGDLDITAWRLQQLEKENEELRKRNKILEEKINEIIRILT